MTVLGLGVIDLPYVKAPSKRAKKVKADTVTTGDVAEWLEDRYHIMEIFARVHEPEIADDLAESVAGALETLMMGGPSTADPFGAAESKITERMKDFISNNEMQKLGYPGVPTGAAVKRQMGQQKSSRKKRSRKSNAEPVSFYDTGLYQSSMIAKVT